MPRLKEGRSPGRPRNQATLILAENFGPMFRASGQAIVRRRKKQARGVKGTRFPPYAETGPFHEFLELVLPPLRDFLRENRLAPVTVESIVRQTMGPASA